MCVSIELIQEINEEIILHGSSTYNNMLLCLGSVSAISATLFFSHDGNISQSFELQELKKGNT